MEQDNQVKSNLKLRYWEAVAYPESMVDNWAVILPDVLQVPCAWCLHDRDDLDPRYEKLLNPRKAHVHIILAFDGPTTAKNVQRIVDGLAKDGKTCCRVYPVNSVRKAYDYLIHDTDTARQMGKFQYSRQDRHECNNFDIGIYVAVTLAQKEAALKKMVQVICNEHYCNFFDFLVKWINCQNDPDGVYFATYSSHSGFLERIMKGVYYHDHPEAKKD